MDLTPWPAMPDLRDVHDQARRHLQAYRRQRIESFWQRVDSWLSEVWQDVSKHSHSTKPCTGER